MVHRGIDHVLPAVALAARVAAADPTLHEAVLVAVATTIVVVNADLDLP